MRQHFIAPENIMMCSLHKISTPFSCRLNRYTLTKINNKTRLQNHSNLYNLSASMDEFIKLHGIFALHTYNQLIYHMRYHIRSQFLLLDRKIGPIISVSVISFPEQKSACGFYHYCVYMYDLYGIAGGEA